LPLTIAPPPLVSQSLTLTLTLLAELAVALIAALAGTLGKCFKATTVTASREKATGPRGRKRYVSAQEEGDSLVFVEKS